MLEQLLKSEMAIEGILRASTQPFAYIKQGYPPPLK